MKSKAIIISGPTGVGKSDFAIKVAQAVSGEIINADIGSFYTPLNIGTAKPSKQEQQIVPHHMIDVLNDPLDFTVVKFRKQLIELCDQIWQRGNIPVVVGGSTLYIQSFFYRQQMIPDTSEIVEQLERSDKNSQELWQDLQKIDAHRAAAIKPSDRYRIIRALAIFQVTGKLPSKFEPLFDPIAPSLFIVCSRSRDLLYQRIDQRVTQMLQSGWIQEVENLKNTNWHSFLLKKKMMGYDELLTYDKNQKFQNIIETIQQSSRNYAKRQITFLRKLKKQIDKQIETGAYRGRVEDIDLTLTDVGLYIRQLLSHVSNI